MKSVEIGRPFPGKFVPLSTSEEYEQQHNDRSNLLSSTLKRVCCFVAFSLFCLFLLFFLYWNLCVFPCRTLDQTRATFGITTVYDVTDSVTYDDNDVSPFPRQSTHQRSSNNQSYSEPFRVVFLGDSLINQAVKFGLKSMILNHLEENIVSNNHAIEMFSCARDGTGVVDLQKGALLECTLPLLPDAVILFWHTGTMYFLLPLFSRHTLSILIIIIVSHILSTPTNDTGIGITEVSDYPGNPLSMQPINHYTGNTTALLSTLIQHVPLVALSSQGILGEGI